MYIAYEQRSGSTRQPDTRSDFYREIVEELLLHRRRALDQPRESQGVLRRIRANVLSLLAYRHLVTAGESANSIPLDAAISAVLTIVGGSADTATELLHEVAVATGLIVHEPERGTLRFIHLSFCEYFAAMEVANRSPSCERRLVDSMSHNRAFGPRFAEVIAFTAGIVPPLRGKNLITYLARSAEPSLLFRALLESQHYAITDVWTVTRRELNALAVGSADSADWIQRFRIVSAVIRDGSAAQQFLPPKTVPTLEELSSAFQFDQFKADVWARMVELDPDLAISMCDEFGLRPERDWPLQAVTACADPILLRWALDNAAAETTGHQWKAVLGEAALEHRLVAARLRRIPTPDIVRKRCHNLALLGGWSEAWPAPNSLLCMYVSVGVGMALEEPFVRLWAIGFIRPQAGRLRDCWNIGPLFGDLRGRWVRLCRVGGAVVVLGALLMSQWWWIAGLIVSSVGIVAWFYGRWRRWHWAAGTPAVLNIGVPLARRRSKGSPASSNFDFVLQVNALFERTWSFQPKSYSAYRTVLSLMRMSRPEAQSIISTVTSRLVYRPPSPAESSDTD